MPSCTLGKIKRLLSQNNIVLPVRIYTVDRLPSLGITSILSSSMELFSELTLAVPPVYKAPSTHKSTSSSLSITFENSISVPIFIQTSLDFFQDRNPVDFSTKSPTSAPILFQIYLE